MRAVLSAAALLALSPFALPAQESPDHKPSVFYFGRAVRGDGPAIGVETRSGSVRDTLGVLVIGVTTNGPADKAGIEEGDRIASANGVDLRLTAADALDREMQGLMSRRLARAVQKVKPGEAIELRVYHDGQYKTVKLTTVKASDLSMDDDAMGDMEFMPGVKAGRLLDDGRMLEGMHLDMMPPMRDFQMQELQALPEELERIKLQMPQMKKLKTLPVEIYEYGVHRI